MTMEMVISLTPFPDANEMTQGNTLMVSFMWEEDTMIADGMVSVGFISGTGNATPQFADAAAVRVIGFDPCETSMRFPFVTNALRLRHRTRLHERFQLCRNLRDQVLWCGGQSRRYGNDGGPALGQHDLRVVGDR